MRASARAKLWHSPSLSTTVNRHLRSDVFGSVGVGLMRDEHQNVARSRTRITREDVFSCVKEFLNKIAKVPIGELNYNTTLKDLSIKSVIFVEIQVALEDMYQVELDPVEIIDSDVLYDVVRYIHRVIARSRR